LIIWVTKSSESTKKCISTGITLHTVVAHFQLWEIFCRSWHAEHFCSLNSPSISNSFWAILITYIKGGTPAQIFFWRRGLQRRGLHLLFFYWSYQVLLTDVVIIPRWAIQALVEYLICIEIISYAKMSDWLLFNSKWEIVQLYLGLWEITPSQFDNYEY
jgi:hypothetical protein